MPSSEKIHTILKAQQLEKETLLSLISELFERIEILEKSQKVEIVIDEKTINKISQQVTNEMLEEYVVPQNVKINMTMKAIRKLGEIDNV